MFFLGISFIGKSQFNLNQIGHIDLVANHNSEGNDIWGYVDSTGVEYAIMGLNDGTSIVSLADPANPTEVFYEPGLNSVWRDIKTWNKHAYVTTEAQNGLLILDLSSLPDASGISANYYNGPAGNEWQSAHNLFIDENGICYIFGANKGNGGALMLDLNTDPLNPTEVGYFDNWYCHDGVAKNDTLYNGHINDGFISIVDVTDKANPVLLGTKQTPSVFSHNLWFSDDLTHVFTTDEVSNGYIGAYDITDPTNIVETDRIQSSPGQGVIPHNAHFINNYLVTSYYRDGLVIHDVSNPHNMIEVGSFDTSPLTGDGFNGAWGAYPWLPSGNIIVSDIETGLYILGPTYQRGCYLDGQVTDANTSAPISNANIEIVTTTVLDNSNLLGNYQTGIGQAGVYDVTYSKPGYYTQTYTGLTFTPGNTISQNVALVPLPSISISGNVKDDNLNNLENAIVNISNSDFSYDLNTDANGNFGVNPFYDGFYDIIITRWGYNSVCIDSVLIDSTNNIFNFTLPVGYYDDFSTDLGWQEFGSTASVGIWERVVPVGSDWNGITMNPDFDVTGDCGNMALVSGNGAPGGGTGANDVDDGETNIASPTMDLTTYTEPYIHFYTWFALGGGNGTAPNDSLIAYITDGVNTEILESWDINSGMNTWISHSYKVSDYIIPTTTCNVFFTIKDDNPGHLVEGGIDLFKVTDGLVSIEENSLNELSVYPNPFNNEINLNYLFNGSEVISVYNMLGKLVFLEKNRDVTNSKVLNLDLTPAIYTLVISSNDKIISKKIIAK